MWILTMTVVDPRNPEKTLTNTVKVNSNYAADFLENEKYNWATLVRMMERGTLRSMWIDYRPRHHGGVRRIRKDADGLFYLEVNGVQIGRKTPSREEAWRNGEVIVR